MKPKLKREQPKMEALQNLKDFSSSEIETVRSLQRLAYDCALWTQQNLSIGDSEKDAVNLMERYLEKRGVQNFFHKPFAWFGDRSSFTGFKQAYKAKDFGFESFRNPLPHFGFDFLPSNRKLENNMGVILDLAPALNGLVCDIGYSYFQGESETHQKMIQVLNECRELILYLVKNKKTLGEVYKRVDELILGHGFKNCHELYPLGVLGHKVGHFNSKNRFKLSFMRFSIDSVLFLAKELVTSPFVKAEAPQSFSPGLWAMEPHFGNDEFGVKFEEILVVTEDDAFWLDNDLPHVIHKKP